MDNNILTSCTTLDDVLKYLLTSQKNGDRIIQSLCDQWHFKTHITSEQLVHILRKRFYFTSSQKEVADMDTNESVDHQLEMMEYNPNKKLPYEELVSITAEIENNTENIEKFIKEYTNRLDRLNALQNWKNADPLNHSFLNHLTKPSHFNKDNSYLAELIQIPQSDISPKRQPIEFCMQYDKIMWFGKEWLAQNQSFVRKKLKLWVIHRDDDWTLSEILTPDEYDGVSSSKEQWLPPHQFHFIKGDIEKNPKFCVKQLNDDATITDIRPCTLEHTLLFGENWLPKNRALAQEDGGLSIVQKKEDRSIVRLVEWYTDPAFKNLDGSIDNWLPERHFYVKDKDTNKYCIMKPWANDELMQMTPFVLDRPVNLDGWDMNGWDRYTALQIKGKWHKLKWDWNTYRLYAHKWGVLWWMFWDGKLVKTYQPRNISASGMLWWFGENWLPYDQSYLQKNGKRSMIQKRGDGIISHSPYLWDTLPVFWKDWRHESIAPITEDWKQWLIQRIHWDHKILVPCEYHHIKQESQWTGFAFKSPDDTDPRYLHFEPKPDCPEGP